MSHLNAFSYTGHMFVLIYGFRWSWSHVAAVQSNCV